MSARECRKSSENKEDKFLKFYENVLFNKLKYTIFFILGSIFSKDLKPRDEEFRKVSFAL